MLNLQEKGDDDLTDLVYNKISTADGAVIKYITPPEKYTSIGDGDHTDLIPGEYEGKLPGLLSLLYATYALHLMCSSLRLSTSVLCLV